MSLSPRARMLVGFVLANALLLAIASALWLNRSANPPLIQGVFLAQSRALPDFSLLDHHGRAFSRSELQGRWHLVSYGFTTCPDICPTTLSQLSVLDTRLSEQGEEAPRVLFYTVDHRRDTVAQLASYVPFFHPDFIGLTHLDDPDNPHLPFEQGLGIIAKLVPNLAEDALANDYEVLHGVTLFLINPAGELQAIFEPQETAPGVQSFDPDRLIADFLAVRDFVG